LGASQYIGCEVGITHGIDPRRSVFLHSWHYQRAGNTSVAQRVRRHLARQTASLTPLLNPFLTDAIGFPLNSTKQLAINFNLDQRRMWASRRGGTGVGRFLVACFPIA
jgi:hypothetical protein